MRIAAVDVDLIPLPAVTPSFAWRRGLRGSAGPRTTAVLRFTTEDGAVGEAYHEWSGPMLADIVDRVLRDELVGERADRREWLWHRLWELDRTEEFPIWLFGVVDVALWDLESAQRLSSFRRNEANIWSVAFAGRPDRFVASSHDWKVALWDTAVAGQPLHVFDGHDNAAQAVATSCDTGSFDARIFFLRAAISLSPISLWLRAGIGSCQISSSFGTSGPR